MDSEKRKKIHRDMIKPARHYHGGMSQKEINEDIHKRLKKLEGRKK